MKSAGERLGHWLLGAFFGGLVLVQGCQTAATDATGEDRLCTPGAYVFCRCADRTKGTKLCEPDGKSYAACAINKSGECVGGEVPDPDTNKKVDNTGEILPHQGDDDDSKVTPAELTELDACPGKPISVPPGEDIKLEGDTSRAVNDRRGKSGGACAAATGAKDFIYHLIPSGSGSLNVTVTGQGALDPIVYLRTTCDDEDSQAACGPQSATKVATTKLAVVTGRDYFLFIDGASGGVGAYSATVHLTTGTFCGDGSVDQGEACDDANHADGDGCNASCRGVDGNPTSGGTCPGQPVEVWPGATVIGKGSTSTYGTTFSKPSTTCDLTTASTLTAADHVYQVTPHATGNLLVTLGTPATGTLPNLMLAAHATCTKDADATKCSNNGGVGGSETMTVPVTNGIPLFIAVEGGGVTTNKGDYTITFKLQ